METRCGAKTLLGVAAFGSFVSLLLTFLGSPNRSLAASRLDQPQERSELFHARALEPASSPFPGRVAAAARAEIGAEPAAGVEALASDREALAARYEQAIEEYVRALDDCATREFDAGRFVTYDAGMRVPESGPEAIVSVRRLFEGRYRLARMNASDYPELYRLRDDVLSLAQALESRREPESAAAPRPRGRRALL